MRVNFKLAVFLAALILPCISRASCSDMIVHLQATEHSMSKNQCDGDCKAIMALRCMGGTIAIPGSSLVQIIRENEGQLCYSDHVCGETSSWSGYVGLAGTWLFYESVISFVTSGAGQQAIIASHRDYNGRTTAASVSLDWGQITRSCKPVSSEICM